jgi:hypothetical protein
MRSAKVSYSVALIGLTEASAWFHDSGQSYSRTRRGSSRLSHGSADIEACGIGSRQSSRCGP